MSLNKVFRNVRCFWSVGGKKLKDLGNYEVVKPGKVSPQKTVPDHIKKPSYFQSGIPKELVLHAEIKNEKQIRSMEASCKLAAEILEIVGKSIKLGQSTDEIDCLVHDLSIERNAYPSPLNYHHFPKSVCTSVNNVACHGIPDDRKLLDGDIINVDITVFYNGYHGDCSKTFLVGNNVDENAKKLVSATELCLNEAINICKPGLKFSEIGHCIQSTAEEMGFKVIPAFLGHGIGSYFHGPPDIFHFRNKYPGVMEEGMTFTIEPVLTLGDNVEIEILEDKWTATTVDSARTAQFEHTILITSNRAEILTKI